MALGILGRLRRKQYAKWEPPLEIADELSANVWTHPLLSVVARAKFLECCWGIKLQKQNLASELRPYESYLQHYESSCVRVPAAMKHLSHQDMCLMVQRLVENRTQSHDILIETFPRTTKGSDGPTGTSSQMAQWLATATERIDFMGRAILLLDIKGWRGATSLAEFIAQEVVCESLQQDQFRFPVSFNARTFERIVGINIVWCNSLFSHLQMGPDMEEVHIFHHAKVLDLYESSPLISIFPEGFIQETRQTLSLMMPKTNRRSREWFRAHQRKHGLDSSAATCPYLADDKRNIQKFKYWRDRLIFAKEVYDESQPRSILQVWRDDRNKVQWWTFWIAVIIFLMTLIGIIEGALQVYKAFHPTPTN